MQLLESKTSSLELQMGLLSSKFDSFVVGFLTASKSPTYSETRNATEYVCEICDHVSTEKAEIVTHKESKHKNNLSCQKC